MWDIDNEKCLDVVSLHHMGRFQDQVGHFDAIWKGLFSHLHIKSIHINFNKMMNYVRLF